jgi:Mor family transcriptional regulator
MSFVTRSRIEATIGHDAARKLMAEFGGQQLYIPRMNPLDDADVIEVRRLKAAGVSVQEIARRKRVSTYMVRTALNKS